MPDRRLEADAKVPRAQALILQCPLLAFDELIEWAAPGWQMPPDDPKFEAAFEERRTVLRWRLREALRRPEVREGLFLVSPDFFETVDARAGTEPSSAHATEAALAEQFIRLATMVTFKALELGPALGEIQAQARLRPGMLSARHTRIDVKYLRRVARAAAALPSVQRQRRWFPSSSLYQTGANVRYLRSKAEGGGFVTATVPQDRCLQAILRRAQGGAEFAELVDAAMSSDAQLTREEAHSYVEELAGEELLTSDLEPTVTGRDALVDLSARLADLPEAEGLRGSLDRAREATGRIDWEPFSPDASRYAELAKLLGTSAAASPAFRVRVFRSQAEVGLPGTVAREILRGAELLANIEGRDDPLASFTRSFTARYGQSLVPLLDALDEESGIPFDAPPTPAVPAGLAPKERLLVRKIEEGFRSGSLVVSLSWEEVASIRARNALPLPDSFCVRGALCASSESALDAGDYQFRLDAIAGPPGLEALGPTAGSDRQLEKSLASYLRAEESLSPAAVFAEIVHFPGVGDANMVFRPCLRAKEIPYLGRSGAAPGDQLPAGDLRLSVSGGLLRLTSQRLEREVIPRLTAPHDYSDRGNPPVYRFLCALQNQGTEARAKWSWGALATAPALPRVVCGKVVLCRAQWSLEARMLKQPPRSGGAARFRALCRIRQRLRLPRFVQAGEGPSASTFDLENLLSAESFIQKMRAEQQLTIFEMFPTLDALCAFGRDGRYVQELTVAFLRPSGAAPASASQPKSR